MAKSRVAPYPVLLILQLACTSSLVLLWKCEQ